MTVQEYLKNGGAYEDLPLKTRLSLESKVFCPYCGGEAEWVENKEIYGKNYGKSYMAYLCRQDNAFVGCHNNSKHPLGTMANKELRTWRMKVHAAIDPFWKSGKVSRGYVYSQISRELGFQYHTGESDIETCKKVLLIAQRLPGAQKIEDKAKAWCKTHPLAYVGKDQFGHYYPTCFQGKKEGLTKCDLHTEGGE